MSGAVEKVFVLLSGGVDSSTALALAMSEFPAAEVEAITIDYGQRHAKEIQAAEQVCEHFKVAHVTIEAKGLMEGMLVDKGQENEAVPDVDYADLAPGISPTYVTFRNGLMLSILAARAQAWVMKKQKENTPGRPTGGYSEDGKPYHEITEFNAYIYLGIHADDGVNWAYPDCTLEFVGPMSSAIYIGTYHRVRVRAPFTFMAKGMIVGIGNELGVPYEKTWSCYRGEEVHCGVCPTCRSRKQAFKDVGLKDPTIYAE